MDNTYNRHYMYCVETKQRIFDSEFGREVAIVVGVPLGLFAALVIGYLIYDHLVY